MLLQCSTEKLLQALTKPQNTLAWIECYTATRTEARVARSQSSSRSGGVDSSFLCFALPAKAPHSSALAEARPTTLLAHVPSPIVCTDARPTTILAPLLPTRASPSPLRTGICPRNVHALANVYALAPAAPSSMCLPSLCCTIASQSKVDSTDIAHAAHCRCDLSAAVCEGMKLLSFFKVEVDPCCLPIAAARVAQQPPGRPNVERDAGLHLKPAWVDEALRVPPLAGRVQSPHLGPGESETKKFVRSGSRRCRSVYFNCPPIDSYPQSARSSGSQGGCRSGRGRYPGRKRLYVGASADIPWSLGRTARGQRDTQCVPRSLNSGGHTQPQQALARPWHAERQRAPFSSCTLAPKWFCSVRETWVVTVALEVCGGLT